MYKKKSLSFVFCCLVIMIFIIIIYSYVAYVVDPLYFYHSSYVDRNNGKCIATDRKIILDGNMRLQAAGIINIYDFNSVVLGTSMLENTSSKYCDKTIGGSFVNLSLSGSNFYERSIILRYLFSKKSINNIVYSMDNAYFNCNKEYDRFKLENWEYIYAEYGVPLIKYFEKKYIYDILKGNKSGKENTPDRPNAWLNSPEHMCRFGGLDNWVKNQDKQGVENFLKKTVPEMAYRSINTNKGFIRNIDKEKKSKKYINDNLFIYAEKFPNTNFYLIFPPYWRFVFAKWRQIDGEEYYLHQEIVKYVVERAELLGNVYVFGFEDCDFVDDISNYKDTTHYHPWINEYMIDSIVVGRHLLTSQNVDIYLDRSEKLALNFDFKELAADVKKYLEEYEDKNKKYGK